jgi:hypothetical protein
VCLDYILRIFDRPLPSLKKAIQQIVANNPTHFITNACRVRKHDSERGGLEPAHKKVIVEEGAEKCAVSVRSFDQLALGNHARLRVRIKYQVKPGSSRFTMTNNKEACNAVAPEKLIGESLSSQACDLSRRQASHCVAQCRDCVSVMDCERRSGFLGKCAQMWGKTIMYIGRVVESWYQTTSR